MQPERAKQPEHEAQPDNEAQLGVPAELDMPAEPGDPVRPKVSVVMPCYNVERFVEQSVRSALEQTLPDIEVVCVDDGSTDSTLSILQRFAEEDERVRVIAKGNTGYGNSMNIGFDAATGRYLGILEPDDYMEPHMLETLYGLAVEHDLDIAKANYFYHRSQPEETDVFCNQFREQDCGFVFCPRETTRVFFIQPAIWAAVYRADFIRGENVQNRSIRFNETPGASFQDTSFNFECLLRARRMYLHYDALTHYRTDNDSSSVNDPGKVFYVCGEYDRIYGLLDEWDDAQEAMRLRKMLVPRKFSTYLWNYQRLSPELAWDFLQRIHGEYAEHQRRGEIDYALFPEDRPELKEHLESILDDPFLYHMDQTEDSDQASAVRTLKRYYAAGGLSGVAKLVRRKLGR